MKRKVISTLALSVVVLGVSSMNVFAGSNSVTVRTSDKSAISEKASLTKNVHTIRKFNIHNASISKKNLSGELKRWNAGTPSVIAPLRATPGSDAHWNKAPYKVNLTDKYFVSLEGNFRCLGSGVLEW